MNTEKIKKVPWWLNALAAFGVGGGSGSLSTYIMIEHVKADQVKHIEEQARKDEVIFKILWEIRDDVSQIKGELKHITKGG